MRDEAGKLIERLLVEADMLNPAFVSKFAFKLTQRLDWLFSQYGSVTEEALQQRREIERLNGMLFESLSLQQRNMWREDGMRRDLVFAIERLAKALEITRH